MDKCNLLATNLLMCINRAEDVQYYALTLLRHIGWLCTTDIYGSL